MKRIIVICLILALLIACQPTPEQEVVFNKGDGTIEDVIESKPVTDYAIQSPSAGAEQPVAEPKPPADERYLLPVWDFMGYTYNARDPEKNLPGTLAWFSGQSLLTISAVDGSIIDRDRGY